jgi:hypothetical protein
MYNHNLKCLNIVRSKFNKIKSYFLPVYKTKHTFTSIDVYSTIEKSLIRHKSNYEKRTIQI